MTRLLTYPKTNNQTNTHIPKQIWILNRRHFAKISKDKRALFLNHTNYLVLSLFWGSLFSYSGMHACVYTCDL